MEIFRFYLDIMEKEGADDVDIEESLRAISESYGFGGPRIADSINFDCAANRAAYLYLYATCHTHAVSYSLGKFRERCQREVDRWKTDADDFKICSIGAGPGCDIVGFLLFVHQCQQSFLPKMTLHCSLVDKYSEWQFTLETSLFDPQLRNLIHPSTLSGRFITTDLLELFSDDLKQSITEAHVVIMNKFVSSIEDDPRCKPMLKKVLNLMQLGGLLVFIDNSGGLARFKIRDVAEECNMMNLHEDVYNFTLDEKQDEECLTRFNNFYSKRKIDVISIIWKKL